ncbi:vam6/Vps39-like protein isoform X2 [Homarus americanus]|uniref:vam6/Vps39-like protein isoform X2 n=1 Tax=Homarus americanus TaxID=6706 RepID=UPI001C45367F|nr:vam6/Vps39-like protein isoform X2 [Homarus americanus]
MHDAYEAIPILEKLPLQIEAVTAYDGNLVVGTRQGHLLMYTVTPGTTRRWDVALLCSNKNFSRKPIVQVAVIPEHQIIVSLSDNVVSVHDLTAFNLPLLCTLSQTKGATAFDLDIKHHVSLTGDGVVTVRLVVAVRRKLQLFYWKARKFHQLREDLALPDVPRALTWCMEAIAVAFKHEYWLVKLTGEQKELFATGRSQEPLITRMVDGEQLALAHDKESIFVDADGNATCSYTLKWVEQPLSLAYDKPYLIAILPKNIEIKTTEPQITVQVLNLDKPKLLAVGQSTKGKSQVYIASSSHVWCLHSIPINQQIPQLLGEKQFGLALKLVDVWDEDEDAKTQMQKHIQHLQAIHLFCSKSYPDAMKLFFTLNTDLPFVIGMYPDMVPEEYRSRLRYPYPIPALSGADLEQALQALIHFLLEMRHQLCSSDSEARTEDVGDNKFSSSAAVAASLKSRNEKLQIIDTTLLKCYVQTNDSLVQPLLRMRDSRVSVVEGERVLRHSHKYPELVLLLQTRGLHQRALQLLIRHAKRPDSPLCGHQHTVNYLQHLGPQHIDLIFEYGGWVLKSHPEDGLKIFIGDKSTSGEVDQLPRPKVLNFLKKTEKTLVIPYLEHVLQEWGDTTPLLHNELIHQYRDIVVAPFTSSDPANVEEEKGRRKIVCEKLLKFLNESKYYTAATLLIHFPYDGLHEERAVLLGRLGQHHQALSIYTNTLRDTQAALRYCQKHYTPSGPGSEVYLTLLKLLVSPIDIRSTSGSPVMQQQQQAGKPDVETVLELLQNHLHCIDLGQALKVLPDEVTLNLLKPFIHASFNLASSVCKQKQIMRGLTQSLKLQTSEELVARQKLKIMLSEYTYCAVCSKRFTKHSAFAWYPNGDIVHFSCQNQRD